MSQIYDILSRIRPEADFKASANYFEDGLLDSFDLVSLVSDLDLAFEISIPGTEITPDNFRNVATIAALLNRYAKIDATEL